MEKGILILLLIGFALGLSVYMLYESKHKGKTADVTQSIDPSTLSNIDKILAQNWSLEASLDFQNKKISGQMTISLKTLVNGVNEIDLDSKGLKVSSVLDVTNGGNITLAFSVVPATQSFLGEQIQILLKKALNEGDVIEVRISYETSQNAEALSWLTPEQTSSKTAPYLFSQCEPISCRSIAPMQDTPFNKITWKAKITVPKNINVFLSGNQTGIADLGNSKVFSYESTMPMAYYVFSIVAGNVALKKVGPRTGVISEPNNLDAYATELSDLEKYLSTVEDYIGAYRWGVYNIVILPPSFPFGGMENPLLTFASPTIIVGDKSGIFVAIHEIAHSWTGNLVTCSNWQNLWLNEGFTVFLERKASSKLYGTEFFKAEAYEGSNNLKVDLNSLGNTELAKLHPYIAGLDPNNGVTSVPYEKGFQFLYYIETLIGEKNMQEMLRAYNAKFALKSIDVFQFEAHLTDYIRTNLPNRNEILAQINYDAWIEVPGVPPVDLNITSEAISDSIKLAKAFVDGQGKMNPANVSLFNSMLKIDQFIFLEELIKLSENVNLDVIKQLNSLYNLDDSKDSEILQRWYTLTTSVNYQDNMQKIKDFVSRVGRIKMVVPLYKNIAKHNKSLAKQIYTQNKAFYHALTAQQIEQVIN